MRFIRNFFKKIWGIIDRKIVVPITKLIIKITGNYDNSGKKIERWLSKSNTLLFISLFLAIIIFVIIDQKIISFSEKSAEILKSLPVTTVYNEEAYIVEGLPETVDVTLIGSKTDLYIAKQSAAHEVKVDLAGLKPGQHTINIKYNQSSGSIDYKVNPSVATVIIYPKVSEEKILTLDLLNQEKLDPKLTISDASVKDDNVTIKGADYKIKQVASVKALINVDNLVKQEIGTTTIKDVPLRAYDKDGNTVDIEIIPAKIDVDMTIKSPSKEVPIRVVPKGDVSFGLAISSIEQSDTKVTIYGDEEYLDSITSIPVEIDVSDLKEGHEYKIDLKKPVGIRSMTINNITVKVQVSSSTDIDIPNVRINAENIDLSKYSVQPVNGSPSVVTVNVKGVENVINKITAEDINAYIDLGGYEPGEYEVEVKVSGSDSKVAYVSKTKKVTIAIKEIN